MIKIIMINGLLIMFCDRTNRSIRDSPQVHISVHGEGEYVGQGSSWAAATDEHSQRFYGTQLQ